MFNVIRKRRTSGERCLSEDGEKCGKETQLKKWQAW